MDKNFSKPNSDFNCVCKKDEFCRQERRTNDTHYILMSVWFNMVSYSGTIDAFIQLNDSFQATGWTTEIRFSAGAGVFLFVTASRPVCPPTKPPIQCVPAALSLGVQGPGREADHSPPSSTDSKNV
jgi:hypothetical protein